MNYTEAIRYIIGSYGADKKHGHDYVLKFLSEMGNPQDKLKIIHVAGTNGKGSTCAMLSSILLASGYNVGLFTSPHLIKFNERISVNGEYISDENFALGIDMVKRISRKIFQNDYETLSFFEILTILAFDYFAQRDIDYVIMETGLGGRVDSTNIISSPVLSVITSIGYDHMEILGDTIEKISYEKGGIIKEHCPVVLYLTIPEAYNTIQKIAANKNSRLYYMNNIDINIINSNLSETTFSVESDYFKYDNLNIKLIGKYQVYNAANTLLCVEALKDRDIKISRESVVKGLSTAFWSGRMEVVSQKPLVILDGAHNIDAAKAVYTFMSDYLRDKRIILVAGILKNKEYAALLDIMCSAAETVILTQAVYSKSVPVGTLYDYIPDKYKQSKKIITEENYQIAYETAVSVADDNSGIIIAGSLYLVGDIRKYLIEKGVVAIDRF